MKKINLSDDEYIIKKNLYGELNGANGEFIITNESIIFLCDKNDVEKKIAFSNIKNPKGHLQAFYDEDEEKVDLLCKDGQYELYFDDFDCEKFINLIDDNINGQTNDNEEKSNKKTENIATPLKEINKSRSNNADIDASVENLKKGFATFAGIAKNVAKASTNYIKDASEKYLQNSQNNSSIQHTESNQSNEQIEDIDELKKKLSKLKEMLDEGLLTHDEYEEKRNSIMGKKKKDETPLEKVLDIAKGKPKVKKCPSCGELLGTFDTKCPSCGYEIRDVGNSNAMEEFQEGLNNIEKMRNATNEVNAFGVKFKLNRKNADIDTTKVEYIRNYVVPRTKEDLMEFMVLAKSNIEPKLYTRGMFAGLHGCSSQDEFTKRKNLSDAWFSMMQQIFDKAKIIFNDEDATYKKIQNMYVDIYNQIM